ncbi:putative quinol monooxygenase [Sphingomonas bacterium]|uniref:putative quinol monooxygenase n=1 Tax=Sphingomonas bacterium TaxID=1895847 RepID=UPI0026131BA5|nr:putative quinol monooxygenase [Sphingomonas bacterium]MDB5679873.1 antibiotic biosynthesis monooxygenase [Sphingomonas bacterium]
MIIVTGSVTAKPGSFDALLEASLAHVHRSRTENGCISHAVRIDSEEPMKLVFFEEWRDVAALQAHFTTPGIADLLAAFREHSCASEKITAYEATELPPLG